MLVRALSFETTITRSTDGASVVDNEYNITYEEVRSRL